MRYLRVALARIIGVFTGRRADDELREELESHLEMATAENIRRGMPPDVARRQALLWSGGLTQAAEAVRAQRGLPWVDNVGADLKYAFRSLRHSGGFTAVVALTLTLGIGANTAIFSVVRGVLLKPLPHRDGDRLVYLRHSIDGPGGSNINFSVPEVRDFRTGVPALAGIAEYSSWGLTLERDQEAVRIDVGLITGNYFDVMGLSPVLGRVTRPSDDGKGVPPVMVLTHEGWLKRFGGDSSIVGQQVILDKTPVTVIGVLQPAPFFPDRAEALLNMVISEHHLDSYMQESRAHRMTEVVARLRPGTSVPQARAEVESVYAHMQSDFKEAYDARSHYRVAVLPFKEVLGERARLTLWLLMGAAAFVMIISAANVANLTLMRSVRREQELVVRAALGAGVARLRRLLLVENLMLTTLGAVFGLILAVTGVRLLTALAERYSPRANEIRLDGVALGVALGLSLAVALLLSFLASLPREGSFAAGIVAGANRITANLKRQRLQRALVVLQVAVSVVLLAGAGLLTRTMIRLADVDTGLASEEVLSMQVPLITRSDRRDTAALAIASERHQRVREEIAALPGVIEVGAGVPVLRNSGLMRDIRVEGKPLAAGEGMPRGELRPVSHNYFRAAGIPQLAGRAFSTADQVDSSRIVIINKTLADRLFPGEDPLGRHLAWSDGENAAVFEQLHTIVGVVGNTRDGGLDAEPRGVVFLPLRMRTAVTTMADGLVIRAQSNAHELAHAATQIVRRIAPVTPIENVLTIAQIKDQSVAPRRLNAVLVSSFGVLAMIIAAVGIAGVLAFSVSARTHEIGIRMSLGADPARVLRMILSEGGMLVVIGLMLGVLGAFLSARVIQGLLFGVTPHDPITFLAVAMLMAAIGIGACWVPALRAARVDPAITMRAG